MSERSAFTRRRGRNVGLDDVPLGLELALGLRTAAVGAVRLVESIRAPTGRPPPSRSSSSSRSASQALASAIWRDGLVEAPVGHRGGAPGPGAPQPSALATSVVERLARIGARGEQRDVGLSEDPLREERREVGVGHGLEVVEERAAGERGRGVGRAVGDRLGRDLGGLVRPDGGGDACEHAAGSPPRPRRRRSRRGTPTTRRSRRRRPPDPAVGDPGVEREGASSAMRSASAAGSKGGSTSSSAADRRRHLAGEALADPAGLDERRRKPDVRDLVERGERRLVEADGDLPARSATTPRTRRSWPAPTRRG